MKKIFIAAILMMAFLFSANQAIAKMYKWVDPNGVIHYSDAPSKSGKPTETIKTPAYPKPSPKPSTGKAKIISEPAPSKETQEKVTIKRKQKKKYTNTVEIYTTSWCRYCKDAIFF